MPSAPRGTPFDARVAGASIGRVVPAHARAAPDDLLGLARPPRRLVRMAPERHRRARQYRADFQFVVRNDRDRYPAGQEIDGIDAECLREPLHCFQRRARPAIFDRTQIRAARARIMGERFLRDAHRKPQFPEIQTEGLRRIHKGVSSRPATITPHWIQVGVIIYIITFLQIFK